MTAPQEAAGQRGIRSCGLSGRLETNAGATPPTARFQIALFSAEIAKINSDPNVSRVVHLGDIKSGSTRCDAVDSEWLKLTFDPTSDEICGWTRQQFASQAPGTGC